MLDVVALFVPSLPSFELLLLEATVLATGYAALGLLVAHLREEPGGPARAISTVAFAVIAAYALHHGDWGLAYPHEGRLLAMLGIVALLDRSSRLVAPLVGRVRSIDTVHR